MSSLYDLIKENHGEEDAARYKELYDFSASLQKEAGANNTLNYFENTVVPQMYNYLQRQYCAQVQKDRFMHYLLYYIDVPDELPQEILFDGWQTTSVVDNLIHKNHIIAISCCPWCYYFYKNHKLPPKSWFDGVKCQYYNDFELYKIIYESCTIDEILQLSQLVNKFMINDLMFYIVDEEIKTKNYKFLNPDDAQNVSGFFQFVEKHIVGLYNIYKHNLPQALKFNGWQKKYENGRTIFSEELIYRISHEYTDILPPTEMWFDGCVQKRFRAIIGGIVYINPLDDGQQLLITPAQYVAYRTKQLPPKELLYDGWQKETITVGDDKLTLAQFWVQQRETIIPSFLRYDGWDTEKFLYAAIKETVNGRKHIIKFYGTMKDAYNYYGIVNDVSDKVYEKYKLSDNGQCAICYEQTTVYNFCAEHHHEGICLKCLQQLKDYKCVICRNDLQIFNILNCCICDSHTQIL